MEKQTIRNIGLIILFSSLMYSGAYSLYFITDDFNFLRGLAQGMGLIEYVIDTSGNPDMFIRPLPKIIIFYIDEFFGINPAVFHSFNVLIATINSLLVYFLVLLISKDKFKSLISALIFSSFYLSYEAVLWIMTGQFELISTMFYLLTVIFFIKFAEENNNKFYLLSLGSFVLALLSKETAVTLIVVLGAYILIYKKKIAFFKLAPFILIEGIFLIILSNFAYSSAINSAGKILNNWVYLIHYIYIPVREITIITETIGFFKISIYTLIANILIELALLGIIIYFIFWSKNKDAKFFILWSIIAIAPIILNKEITPRYLYLPAIGSLSFMGLMLSSKNKSIAIALCALIILSGYVNFQDKKNDWGKASKISERIIISTKGVLENQSTGKEIYFMNLPDRVCSRYNWDPSYVIGNLSFIFAEGSDSEHFVNYYPKEVKQIRSDSRPFYSGGTCVKFQGELITQEEYNNLLNKPNAYVIIFSTKMLEDI